MYMAHSISGVARRIHVIWRGFGADGYQAGIEEHFQIISGRQGARPRLIQGAQGHHPRALRGERRRKVHADEDHQRHLHAGRGRDTARRQAGEDRQPHPRPQPGHLDDLSGAELRARDDRGGEHLPGPVADGQVPPRGPRGDVPAHPGADGAGGAALLPLRAAQEPVGVGHTDAGDHQGRLQRPADRHHGRAHLRHHGQGDREAV